MSKRGFNDIPMAEQIDLLQRALRRIMEVLYEFEDYPDAYSSIFEYGQDDYYNSLLGIHAFKDKSVTASDDFKIGDVVKFTQAVTREMLTLDTSEIVYPKGHVTKIVGYAPYDIPGRELGLTIIVPQIDLPSEHGWCINPEWIEKANEETLS